MHQVESTCIKLFLISATESARTSQKDKEFIDIDGISDRGSLNARRSPKKSKLQIMFWNWPVMGY